MTDCIKAICPTKDPPVLLFDLGNILVRLNSVDLLWPGQTPAFGTLPYAERWAKSRAVYAYETGRIDDLDAFYLAAKAELGFTVPEGQFNEVFQKIIGDLFAETIPMLQALKDNYPLMLLSNTCREHWLFCRDQLGLGGFFQEEFLSYEMGVMKPDPLVFQEILERLQNNPQNIWYFDDKAENAAVARKFGIRAFTSWGGPPLIGQLESLGLIQAAQGCG